jgi:hypothetical protein
MERKGGVNERERVEHRTNRGDSRGAKIFCGNNCNASLAYAQKTLNEYENKKSV